jgi:hypothetical protein
MLCSIIKPTLIVSLAIAFLHGIAATQTGNESAKPKAFPAIFEINLVEDPDLGSMPWPSDWADPGQGDCDENGNVYVWTWPPGHGLAAFTPKGIVTFFAGQMTDVPTPDAHGAYISEAGIYVGVDGVDNPKQDTKTIEDKEGQKLTLTRMAGEQHRYIARFDRDGTYKGSLRLELPFYVSTFGAFDSGGFVAQGLDENKIPRVALLDSAGQLIRYLFLEKDISAVSEIPASDLKYGGTNADSGSVAMTSEFTPSHGKVLFLRSLANAQVYEIQESGEVRIVKIKAPAGYDVERMIRSDRNWFASFRKPNNKGVWANAEHSIFEIDPASGQLLREYRMKSPDLAVSCFMNNEFLALHTQNGKLTVLRGEVRPYSGH